MNIDGTDWTIKDDNGTRVVGTVRVERVLVQIGGGSAIHAGTQRIVTVTEDYEMLNKHGHVTSRHHAGDIIKLEPRAFCATVSTYKTGGYANGWHGRNGTVKTGEVTCKKCLA